MEIIEKPMPFFSETQIPTNNAAFYSMLRETQEIDVEVSAKTTSTCYISVRRGKNVYSLNRQTPGFKFLTKSAMNFLTGESVTHHYFKLTSKQGREALQTHITQLLSEYFVDKGYPIKTVNLFLSRSVQLYMQNLEEKKTQKAA